MNNLNLFLIPLAALALSACASITSSKHQPVSVVALYEGEQIDEASCTLINDKGTWYTKTPGTIMIQKSYGDLSITCKKKGYQTGITNVASSSNGGVWGNILAGGVIGYAVDASSGAGFDYPTGLHVIMGTITTLKPEVPKSAQTDEVQDRMRAK